MRFLIIILYSIYLIPQAKAQNLILSQGDKSLDSSLANISEYQTWSENVAILEYFNQGASKVSGKNVLITEEGKKSIVTELWELTAYLKNELDERSVDTLDKRYYLDIFKPLSSLNKVRDLQEDYIQQFLKEKSPQGLDALLAQAYENENLEIASEILSNLQKKRQLDIFREKNYKQLISLEKELEHRKKESQASGSLIKSARSSLALNRKIKDFKYYKKFMTSDNSQKLFRLRERLIIKLELDPDDINPYVFINNKPMARLKKIEKTGIVAAADEPLLIELRQGDNILYQARFNRHTQNTETQLQPSKSDIQNNRPSIAAGASPEKRMFKESAQPIAVVKNGKLVIDMSCTYDRKSNKIICTNN